MSGQIWEGNRKVNQTNSLRFNFLSFIAESLLLRRFGGVLNTRIQYVMQRCFYILALQYRSKVFIYRWAANFSFLLCESIIFQQLFSPSSTAPLCYQLKSLERNSMKSTFSIKFPKSFLVFGHPFTNWQWFQGFLLPPLLTEARY